MLNRANWPFYIANSDGSIQSPLSSLDCLIVYQKLKKIKQGQDADPKLVLPLDKYNLDLSTMTATSWS